MGTSPIRRLGSTCSTRIPAVGPLSAARLVSALLCSALLVSACSMVPMRTLLKLSTMGQDLLTLDPRTLRVAVQHEAGLEIEEGSTHIAYVVTERSGGVTKRDFGVEVLGTGSRVDRTLPVAEADQTWSLLAVTPEGVDAMRELQEQLANRRDELAEIQLSVTTRFESPDDGTSSDRPAREKFPLEIWVLLEPDGKFIQLLRGSFEMESEAPDDGG